MLKDIYKENYKGGILLIDELDATLHPHAQKQLIHFLSKASTDYEIQIIFTTHSNHIIDSIKEMVLKDKSTSEPKNNMALFLKNIDNKVEISEINDIKSFNQVDANLNLIEYHPKKINLYCEDSLARKILKKCLQKKLKDRISIVDIDFGFTEYLQMHRKNFANILESILIFDSDVKNKAPEQDLKYIERQKNITYLLNSEVSYEESFYIMLKDMSEKDFEATYKQEKGIYFQNCPIQEYERIKGDSNQTRDFVKHKFFEKLPKNIQTKVIAQYINKEKSSVIDTQEKIKKIFNYLAEKLQIESVD